MSYSFSFKAPNKAEAKWRIQAELKKVVEQQPPHAADCEHHQVLALQLVDQLSDSPDKEVAVSMSGAVTWSGEWKPGETTLGGLTFGFSAHLMPKQPAAQ